MGAPKPKDNKKKAFDEILSQSASVDDIFKDSPVPKGTDPFEQLTPVQGIELNAAQNVASSDDTSVIKILDNDGLFCINRKFAALEGMLKLITKECTFGELSSEILRIAMEQVPSEAGSIIEIDFENENMFFRAVSGKSSKNLLSFTIPLGQGIVGFVCENQQSMALSKVDESSVYLKSISDSVGFETRNVLAFPIVIRGVTFGCIELLNRLGEDSYTDADKEVLGAICNFAAKVIENRLLLAALTKELAEFKGQGEAA